MKFYRILLVLLFSSFSFAQEIDTTLVQLEEKLANTTSDTEKIKAMLALGEYELDHNFSKAEYIITEAFELSQKNKETTTAHDKALIQIQLGVLKRRKSEHAAAIKHYLNALSFFEGEKDTANMADVYHNIGTVHKFQKDFTASFSNYDKSLQLNTAINNKEGIALVLLMKGSNYRALKKLDSAEIYYKKCKDIFVNLNDSKGLQQVNNFLVRLYLRMNKVEEALQLNQNNIAIAKKNNEKLNLVTNYIKASDIYYKEKEYRIAGKYIDSALKLAKKEGFKDRIAFAYGKKSRLWYKLKNYKSAYFSHRKYKSYSDSLYNIDNTKKIQELELKFKFQQEKREVQLLADNESAKKKIYLILFIITLLLSAIIAFLVKRDFKYKKRLLQLENKALLREKEQITNAFNQLKNSTNAEERIKAKQEILKLKILTDDDWLHFRDKFELLYPSFLNLLKDSNFQFTKSETRFLILKKLDLETKEIANMTGVSNDSVLKTQYRLRKKLDIAKTIDIINFLEHSTQN
ncbi:tetratricopeptide repeat protein [uncultured Kordia sp.]|uniref:tetratricopeptide repeat protein n=1 Tax=uncultured Kordia sp. TaxID=507699 RepID=UPI00262424AB|nr:tetratricopeptide repeat protein [uncultured Kordia sp.]